MNIHLYLRLLILPFTHFIAVVFNLGRVIKGRLTILSRVLPYSPSGLVLTLMLTSFFSGQVYAIWIFQGAYDPNHRTVEEAQNFCSIAGHGNLHIDRRPYWIRLDSPHDTDYSSLNRQAINQH